MSEEPTLLTEDYMHRVFGRLNAIESTLMWALGELTLKSDDPKNYATHLAEILKTKANEAMAAAVPSNMQLVAVREFNEAMGELAQQYEDWVTLAIDEPVSHGKKPGDLSY